MATLWARGRLELGQPFRHEGILGTTFVGSLVEEARVGPYAAVVPTITGSAWITSISQYVLDAEDPFPEGFTVGDLWATSIGWFCFCVGGVVRASSGEVLGIAPLMLTERPSRGPLRIRVLQFIGADPNITELRLMLCDPLFERDCYQALMRHLASPAERWDWVAWEARGPDIGTALGMRDPLVGVEERSTFILDLPSTWDEFKKGLGRNIKESLRHCYNSLKRDELTFRLEVLTGPEEIVSALPEFFRLHTARANFKGALRHTDVFASLRAREFLVEVCRRLATRGAAHVFQLWVDDQLVSTRIGFRLGDALYLYYSGWDPDYGRYAVMTTLLAEVIQYAIAQGLGCVNLSTGKDVSKTRWGTREVCYAGGRQISPRLNARAVHFVYDRAVRARTNKVARVLMPAFLVRGSPTRAALTPEGGTCTKGMPRWQPSRRPTCSTGCCICHRSSPDDPLCAPLFGVMINLVPSTLDGRR